MAVYAIGDVQGCFDELTELLDHLDFRSERDQLWFTGDLVNRGPQSLAVLRFVRALDDRAVSVLGNHDLHLLAIAAGARASRREDTFQDILAAPDCDQLIAWLRERPTLYHDTSLNFTLIHAGLAPEWDLRMAQDCAQELETTLRGTGYVDFLHNMYGDTPDRWSDDLDGVERLRFITNCLTRIRYFDRGGHLSLHRTGPPEPPHRDFVPWFEMPNRRSKGERIIFGHWASLQLHRPLDPTHGVFHVDTGCGWGGRLTALRLDDERYFSVPCARFKRPT